MAIDARIGIIGGNGWLGGAIAAAALETGVVAPDRLTLSGRTDKRGAVDSPEVHWTRDNRTLVARSDVIILSIRPEQFADVDIDVGDRLVISVMAGMTARSEERRVGKDRRVR